VTTETAEPVRALLHEADEERSRGLDRALAAVSVLGVGVLLLGTLTRSLKPLEDPDVWWHLRVGQQLRGDWRIASPGALSEFATEEWVARDWLPQVAASWMAENFGLVGVGWLVGAGYLVCVLTLWHSARAHSSPLPSLLATSFGFCGLLMSMTPRPQLVSFALLAVFVSAWLRTAVDLLPRWHLVPLTGLWACCHGMWISGVIVGFAVIGGMVIERKTVDRDLAKIASIPLLGMLLAMVTPAGPGVVLAAVEQNETRQFISEWQPTTFASPASLAIALGLALVVLTAVRRGGLPWPNILLLGLAAAWTAMSMRTVALGAVLVTPLLAASVQSWTCRPQLRPRRVEALTVFGIAAGVLVVLAALVPGRVGEADRWPQKLDTRLAALPSGTVILNSYELGGWLEWRYPTLTPVIDGNTPAYRVDHVGEYMSAKELRGDWDGFVASTDAEYALLHEASPLAEGLRLKDWQELAEDADYVLLRSPRT
jgi:hypothetical protein